MFQSVQFIAFVNDYDFDHVDMIQLILLLLHINSIVRKQFRLDRL